ncbi:MAG: molybdate transport system substrate-binding protein [Candidatus Poriferisodalaceae bacterium]|jgi:molybdate transport system substrate-binding protein
MRQRFASVALCLAGLFMISACTSSDDATITVLAASSLRPVLDELISDYEQDSGVEVEVSYAGSQTLAAQINEGFPADVFISADRSHIDQLTEAGLLLPSTPIANNSLAILVPASNTTIQSIDDVIADSSLVIVAADPAVPLGSHTRQALDHLGPKASSLQLASLEASAQAVVSKLLIGEADVAFGYLSDGQNPNVRAVTYPGPALTYEAAVTTGSTVGPDFIAYLTAAEPVFVAAGYVGVS